ncbi:MAG: YheT family hydrolase [Rhodospirillaceae bacterium]
MNLGYQAFGGPLPNLAPYQSQFPWYGGDFQTIKNSVIWEAPVFHSSHQTRMQFAMDDGTGDHLLGVLDRPDVDTELPLLILVHGLTGSESSRNIKTSAAHFIEQGFMTLRLNQRGAGPSSGLCKEHYHAGRSQDLAAVLDGLPNNLITSGIVIVGISLGGNTVLKMIGEASNRIKVRACASVCAPIDLKKAQLMIMTKRNRIYHHYLITKMKKDALEIGDKDRTRRSIRKEIVNVRTVYDYDNLIVAPNNGFEDAEDYYTQSSAMHLIDKIDIPTLFITSKTDPWIPVSMYTQRPWPTALSKSLIVCDDGGHVGFHQKDSPVPWHNACISTFFKHQCS